MGPDLAFIPIHPVGVERINAKPKKLFYNLDKHRTEMLAEASKIENGLWALVGTPALKSNFEDPERLEFGQRAYSVGIDPPITKDDFDYIDIRVALDGKNALPTFEGVSGGGLWQAEMGRTEDGSLILVSEPRLEGCAFYQTSAQGEYRYIRCHGRRSIYEHGFAKLNPAQE